MLAGVARFFLKMNCCSGHRGEVGHYSRGLKTSVYQCLTQAIAGHGINAQSLDQIVGPKKGIPMWLVAS